MLKNTFVLILSGLLLFSCSEFNKVQKNGSLTDKLNAAYKYYEKKDYYKATVLFEEVVPLIRGQKEAEKALFYYAYTYYNQKQYIMSAFYFREFYETFPRSQYTEESMFMYGKSLYKDSPEHNLDQTNSYDAIKAIQRFASRYPSSGYMTEANKMMDELYKKLEEKDYQQAKLYYNLSEYNTANYKSAVITLDGFLKRYPTSTHLEEIYFLKADAQYNLAKHSAPDKQRERFFEAIDYYHNFIDKYPSSKFKKQAEEMYEDCLNRIEKLNS